MAGANESPRQKMIGMMYLVLTALLALQVSSSILQKFMLLNNSVEAANSSANEKNVNSLKSIKEAVGKSSNPALYADVIKKADQTRELANKMYEELDKLKIDVIKAGGGEKDGKIVNLAEEEAVAILMVGQGNSKNGKAYALKNQLNTYVENLKKLADPGTELQLLGLDANEDPSAKAYTDQKGKDFAEYNFAQTPVPAALAVLSQKQAEVRRYENTVLDQLAAKVGAKEVKFDKIFGMVSAKSNTVVAGTPFEAEMFIAASSSAITPRMSFNGAGYPVKDGKAQIRFTAQGGSYDSNGLSKRTYSGSISYNDPAGGAKTIPVTGEYFVAKPTYNIESGTLPPLYLGCANRLSVQSPGLGALWNPSFNADGADIILGGGKGKITIVPSAAKVALNIINSGNKLGTENFRVQRVPKPTIAIYGNGSPVDEKRGASASGLRSISIKAEADESFRNFNPEDAQFRISEIEVSLARGNRRIGNVTLPGGGSISSLAQQAQPGDRYVIEIKGCQRKNFRGSVESVNLGTTFRTIPLN
jgi:gliding motility-associated protein GldM